MRVLRSFVRLPWLALLLVSCIRPNLLPVIVSDPVFSVAAGSVISSTSTVPACGVVRLQVTAYDPDGGTLKYSYVSNPPGALEQLSPNSASVSWVLDPAPSTDVPVSMTITVTDPAGGTASRTIHWLVQGGPLQFCGTIYGRVVPGLQYLSTPDVPSDAEIIPNEAIVKYKTQSLAQKLASNQISAKMFDLPISNDTGVLRRPLNTDSQNIAPQSIGSLSANDARASTLEWIAELRTHGDVEYAEPNYVMHTQALPADPLYSNAANLSEAGTGQQWHYEQLNLPAAWNTTTGSAAVVVAVVDTGILYSQTDPSLRHPDFDCLVDGLPKVLPGYDFGQNDADPFDDAPTGGFHGTHVAGTIGACEGNNIGGTGVAWKTRILPVRAISGSNGGIANVARAIRWAAGENIVGVPNNPNPAQIINLSLGNRLAVQQSLQEAVDAANARGAVVVAAAGNASGGTLPGDALDFTPANLRGVIVVGALGPNKALAPYSYYGAKITTVAPGGNLSLHNSIADEVLSSSGCKAVGESGRSTGKLPPCDPGFDFGYAFLQGTSMAAPHVSGAIALMMANQPQLRDPSSYGLDPKLNWARVMRLLRLASSTTGLSACEPGCGAGLLDAKLALDNAGAGVSPIGSLLNIVSAKPASKTIGVLDLSTTTNTGTVVVRNDGDVSATVSSNVFGPGLSISPNSFTVAPGAQTTLTVSLNRSLVNPTGQYAARIVLDDNSGRPVNLRVYYQQGSGRLISDTNFKVRLFQQTGYTSSGSPTRLRLTYPGVDVLPGGLFKFTGLSTSSKYAVSAYRSASTNPDTTVVTDQFGERIEISPVAEGLSETEVAVNPSSTMICSEAGTPGTGPTACP